MRESGESPSTELIRAVLGETLTETGMDQWMQAPNRLLGGRRPVDVIGHDLGAVEHAARSFAEGTNV